MKYILLLATFFFIYGISSAQGDSADVKSKRFDEKKWKEIVGATNYEEDSSDEPKARKAREFRPWFTIPGVSPALMKAISFAIVFGLFAFILYYVSRNTTIGIGKKKVKPADIASPVENIDELDAEALLKDALASGDLRLAIRVQYLLLLKKLNEVGLIKWKKDKTNRDYLSELYGRNAVYDDVRILTLAYELIWYGERAVNADFFRKLSDEFDTVSKQITTGHAAS